MFWLYVAYFSLALRFMCMCVACASKVFDMWFARVSLIFHLCFNCVSLMSGLCFACVLRACRVRVAPGSLMVRLCFACVSFVFRL